jgi:hypothetical protein
MAQTENKQNLKTIILDLLELEICCISVREIRHISLEFGQFRVGTEYSEVEKYGIPCRRIYRTNPSQTLTTWNPPPPPPHLRKQ